MRPFSLRRLGEREDRAVELDAGVVAGDRAAGPVLLRLVVARQVGADRRPASGRRPACGRARCRRGRRSSGRAARPRSARSTGSGSAGRRRRGPRGCPATRSTLRAWPRAVVVARDDAEVLAGVDDVRVARVGDRVAGLAAADGVPVAERRCRPATGCCSGPSAVPRSCIVPITRYGHRVVDGDVVELRDRQRRRVPASRRRRPRCRRRRRSPRSSAAGSSGRSRGRGGRRGGCPSTLLNVLPPSMVFSSGTCGNQTTSGFCGSTVSVE